MSNIVPYDQLTSMAQAFAKSQLFGAKTPEQALALLLLAQGEGLHPAIAMRDFDIIQGRPAKKAEAMLRSFLQNGGRVEWHQLDDECADATFSHPQGGTARITWDMKRAKQAGVGNKDMYNKYPRQMLRSRVVSEGCRTVFPASTSGLYVPEEVIQFRGEKDITPTAGVMSALPIKEQEQVMAVASEVRSLLANDQTWDAYSMWRLEAEKWSADEQVAFWSQLDSKQRGVLSRMRDEERAKESGTINPQQKKRLEAIIKESGQDRDTVKAECVKRWGIEHFQDLTREQYDELIAELQDSAPPPTPPSVPAESTATVEAGALPLESLSASKEQVQMIESLIEQGGGRVKAQFDLQMKKNGWATVADIPHDRIAKVIKWLDSKIMKETTENI